MIRLTKWPIALLLILGSGLIVPGCGGGDEEPPKTGLQTIEKGKLRVGSDPTYAPFEFGRGPNYEGFDVDIVNEIASRLELETEIVRASFGSILRNLAQGRFDMVASATIVQPESKRIVDFSDPYFAVDQSLLVKEGSNIRSVEDLGRKRVGAQLGTTGSKYAAGETQARVRNYNAISDAFNALEASQIDAVINDFPSSQREVRARKNLKIVDTISTGEVYGLAFNKESDALRDVVNTVLTEMWGDGAYARIYRKWFRKDPPQKIF